MGDLKPYLNGNGGIFRPKKGIPVQLSLELVPILAVDKLEHRLVNHVRLKQENVMMMVVNIEWIITIQNSICIIDDFCGKKILPSN